ncbi:lovastatin nonaketide synthase [Xylariaceae sp. FL1651]|nr:lovastatin nonaketide synthase [Xylariaceae sp. FL1651]
MPYIGTFTPSASSSTDGGDQLPQFAYTQSIIDDASYAELAGKTFPGYTEKPLSEQLEPIAVVGMGCRLPGDVKSPQEFWDMMINKRSGQMEKVPSSRFDIDAHYHENNDRPGSFAVKGGYFLHETLKEFDPNFFGVTPIEAMWMDPQQRKLLEVVYETFESAGVTLDEVSGSKTAVFVASFTADFQQMAFKEPSFRHSLAATGVDPGIISNRISHVFNLRGPSIVVNTACSSSVYAMHNACNALRNKECAAAVVGGVNLVLTVDQHMNTAKLGVLSETSTCHTFDASADGYGRAEGVGAVYLKRLSDAIRDGDPIRGLLRSSATNNNGKVAGVGITHPNLDGQEAVIRHAYQRGGELDPRLTGLFECHGTGTAVGDPLEVHAVANAMNENRQAEDGPLVIGAVKTNIGHSEAASGLSAIIKAILTVERGIIPPTKGVDNPNPAIDWKGWQVAVNHAPQSFSLPIKRVSVNSFGYGGTNAHVIVESADSLLTQPQMYKYNATGKPRQIKSRGKAKRNRPSLLLFSAHDNPTLRRNISAIGKVAGGYDLLDLSYTLGERRTHLKSRGMAVTSAASLAETFQEDMSKLTFLESKSAKAPTLAFVFTGQGAQWAGMGAELMQYYPSFLRTIRHLDSALEDLDDAPDWTIEDLLLEPAATSRVDKAEYAQPLCTAVQIAIVNLLIAWNVHPKVTVGHSSGEIAAAYAAGLISATDAIVAAYYRGKVVRDIEGGAMLAVGLGAEDAEAYLADYNGKVVVACHNSTAGVTLSGDKEAIESLQKTFEEKNVFARVVKTNGKAYHSHHMSPVAEQYETLMQRARQPGNTVDPRRATDATMVSSVFNRALGQDTVVDEQYWSANLVSPVRFNQAIQTIAKEFPDVDLFVEIGPHSAMSGPIRQIKAQCQLPNLNYLPSLTRNNDCAVSLLKLAGELFMRGYDVSLPRVNAIEESSTSGKISLRTGSFIVDLPTYQWDKTKQYFAEARMSKEHRAPPYMRHDILGAQLFGGSKAEPTWRNVLRLRDLAWLKDHSLGGEAVFPAAGYFSMAIEAITQLNETSENPIAISSYTLRDVSIKNALVTPDDDNGIEVMLNLRPSLHANANGNSIWWDFNVSSIDQDGYKNDHMAGSIAINARSVRAQAKPIPQFNQRASGKSWNQALRNVGFDYGTTFQDMDDIRFDGKTYAATSKTALRTTVDGVVGESRHILHPACVDSCLQLLIVAIYAGRASAMPCGAVPIQVDELSIWVPTPEQLETPEAQAFSWIDERGVRSFVGSNQLIANDGKVVMEITDMRCSLYEAAVPQRDSAPSLPRTYGQMYWKQDIDDVVANGADQVTVVDFVELADFKKPGLKVLDLHGAYAEQIAARETDVDITVSTEDDESQQSLKANTFDLVICRSDDSEDLVRAKDLLVAGGRAIVPSDNAVSNEAAIESGFQGLEQTFSSFFTAKVSVNETNGKDSAATREAQLICRSQVAEKQQFCLSIKAALEGQGYAITTANIEDPNIVVAENVLILADIDRPLLVDISEAEFYGLQKVTNGAKNILWITNGGLMDGTEPAYNMTAGLTRSLRSEQVTSKILTVDFDTPSAAIPVRQVAKMLADHIEGNIKEREYRVANGATYISRLGFNAELNANYCVDESDLRKTSFDPAEPLMGKIQAGQVVFQADERVLKPLGDDEVEVQVRVSSLNKEDSLCINGQDYPTDFSHEIGGVVTRVGKNVTRFAPGDLAAGFSFDRFATFQRTSHDLLQKIESEKDMEALADMPMAFGAALYGLQTSAAVRRGESVLILPGAGFAGHAAVQVASLLEANVFIGVNDASEVEAVAKRYNLPTDRVLPVQELEQSRSASSALFEFDVIFSSGWVDATVAREMWRHLAPLGRFIDCGRKNVLSRTVIDTIPVHRGASYLSFDMLELYAHRPHLLADLWEATTKLYLAGSLSPLNAETRHIAEINNAVASFSDSWTAAKPYFLHKEQSASESEATPLLVVPTAPSLTLRSDASYLLIGCLGGLGRSLTSWMMSKGAKNFIFLSRSGSSSKQASSLVKSLTEAGADVNVVVGDASVRTDVDRALKQVDPSRPVRGVIHAAMVLRDGLFHNMPFENWIESTKPKVMGAMNLHETLINEPLDFFVMTSSISGLLGTPAQSNYAAGNTYMDALASQRVAQGKHAASIVIPMVLGVGVVAENIELEASLKRKGMYGIDEESLMAAFEAAILEQGEHAVAKSDHLVAGFDPSLLASAIAEAGEDVDSFWTSDPRFRGVVHAMKSKSAGGEAGGSLLASLVSGELGEAEAKETVAAHMAGKLSRMLMLEPSDVSVTEGSISSYGIDSMIGAELRTWIFKEFGVDVPFQQLLGQTLTINKFAELVYSKHAN